MRTLARWIACLSLACLAGCAGFQSQRAYVWDSEYEKVRDLYDECGSIHAVIEVLQEHGWTRAQINEVRYRLGQDFSLDEKGMPRVIKRERLVVRNQPNLGLGPNRSNPPSPPPSTPPSTPPSSTAY